jgi:catechol 2,3-dioxygenase-like lactoylglutathione lyase family enzyme
VGDGPVVARHRAGGPRSPTPGARSRVVFSRTLDSVQSNARLAEASLAEEVATALDVTDKDVSIGGVALAAAAIELGLVDELRVFRNPVVVGGGTPFLPPVTAVAGSVGRVAAVHTSASRREKSRCARTEGVLRGLVRPGEADSPSSPAEFLDQLLNGSLGRVFDHVGIAVSDLAASERFYRTVLSILGVEPSHADAELVEWDDWDIGPTDREHPVTRGLHVGFRARDRAQVDAFWQAGVDAGYRDDGEPGSRTQYGPTYYGGFLLDPDGNSVEAVHGDREDAVPVGRVDHLWIRVRDPQASRHFYTTIAPHAGLRLVHDEPGRVQLSGTDYSFSLVRDERPLTEHVHLAFRASEDSTVRAFHAAALVAGYEDHGEPGERAVYHPGYYGAFVLDPDGHGVEVVNHNRG